MSITNTHKAKTARRPVQKVSQARQEEKVRILAARLRLTTDRKLNKATPEWVKELADKAL